jgi:uncharacterized secreted protein with C-terminal beta-propeller domain
MERRDKALIIGMAAVAVISLTAVMLISQPDVKGISNFENADEFSSYLNRTPDYADTIAVELFLVDRNKKSGQVDDTKTNSKSTFTPAEVERDFDTHIRSEKVEKPSILKASGNLLFYSSELRDKTKIVSTSSAGDLNVTAEIPGSGRMLLDEASRNLVTLHNRNLVGYDVDGKPTKKWISKLNRTEDTNLVKARMQNGSLYVLLGNRINNREPCPIHPISVNKKRATVECKDIYYPTDPTNIDTIYTVIKLHPGTGKNLGMKSFVGPRAQTNIYFSSEEVYITYADRVRGGKITLDFALTRGKDLINQDTIDRLEDVERRSISNQELRIEVRRILTDWVRSLDEEEQKEKVKQLKEKYESYIEKNLRQFEKTGVVSLDPDTLTFTGKGEVPGYLINRSAMDQKDGNLRIATTVGESISKNRSENDLYVLNETLEIVGSVKGITESYRLDSIWFMEDAGFAVTEKQYDPLYVLDLSDTTDPSVQEKIKLPGHSSSLHQLSGNRVLGLADSVNSSKPDISSLTVFDTTELRDLKLKGKRTMNDHDAAIFEKHPGFLHDNRYDAFFVPGPRSSYIFTYDRKGHLTMEKRIYVPDIKRASYIENNMYVVSEKRVLSINENNWSRVGHLSFEPPDESKKSDTGTLIPF